MTIRKAKIEDAEAIFLIRNTTEDKLEKKSIQDEILNSNYLMLVAEENGKVIGFLSILKNYDCADVMMIATDLTHRRCGVARSLLGKSLEILKGSNVTRLMLEVNETNIGAIKLYEKLGFKRISIRKNYYKGQFNALIMELLI